MDLYWKKRCETKNLLDEIFFNFFLGSTLISNQNYNAFFCCVELQFQWIFKNNVNYKTNKYKPHFFPFFRIVQRNKWRKKTKIIQNSTVLVFLCSQKKEKNQNWDFSSRIMNENEKKVFDVQAIVFLCLKISCVIESQCVVIISVIELCQVLFFWPRHYSIFIWKVSNIKLYETFSWFILSWTSSTHCFVNHYHFID